MPLKRLLGMPNSLDVFLYTDSLREYVYLIEPQKVENLEIVIKKMLLI